MKKIIRLTESDLARIVKRVIKENEEDWISQSEDMEGDSDFSKMEKLKSSEDFQELVDFFKKNHEAAEEIKSVLEDNLNEGYKYYDYGDNKKEIRRNQYLKRKLATYGVATLFSGILGYMMGTMAGDEILQAALLMAGMGGFTFGSLASEVGREKVDDEEEEDEEELYEMEDEEFMRGADKNWDDSEDYGTMRGRFFDDEEEDEEWGQTDRGEEELQDLIEEARDFLENECGYELHDINLMSEDDIVVALYDEGNDELAEEIESLLYEEGHFEDDMPSYKTKWSMPKDSEEELGEGWDDFTQKKRYPEDYRPEKYRSIPKDFFRKNLGHRIDSEGTKLSRRREKPFDDYEDFDDEEFV